MLRYRKLYINQFLKFDVIDRSEVVLSIYRKPMLLELYLIVNRCIVLYFRVFTDLRIEFASTKTLDRARQFVIGDCEGDARYMEEGRQFQCPSRIVRR